MKNRFARDVAIRITAYIAMLVLVFIGNYYLCRWIYASLEFKTVLDALEELVNLLVYSYAAWAIAFTIPPVLLYFRKRKEPNSVLKASSLICALVMILSDTCMVLLYFYS